MRTSLLEFTVPGNPVPKARPRVLRSGITYTPKTTKEYEQRIAWTAKAAWKGKPMLLDKGYGLTVHFGREAMRGDLDNLIKAVCDGLQGVIYRNDSQVWQIEAREFPARPGFTEVELWIADSNSDA